RIEVREVLIPGPVEVDIRIASAWRILEARPGGRLREGNGTERVALVNRPVPDAPLSPRAGRTGDEELVARNVVADRRLAERVDRVGGGGDSERDCAASRRPGRRCGGMG